MREKKKTAGSRPADKVWSGRFAIAPSLLMEQFSSSVATDQLLWREDVAVNRAWARALRDAGLLSTEEERRLQHALTRIGEEFRTQRFVFLAGDEDIHVAIERRLTETAGPTGAKIHTGRSRNDQVATDLRLYLKKQLVVLQAELCQIVEAAVVQAEVAIDCIMPGYTHTQQAQPVRLAHYLLSMFPVLRRHRERVDQALVRLDEMPLGSGALAGTAFAIDRRRLARDLGFTRVSENSVDATGSRDVCAEVAFLCAAICTTLSRYAGDFVLWAAQEFGFLDPGESFATGSSMMPNKKNPDAFELIRGKAAAVIGSLAAIMAVQKGSPVTYSRDLQEQKKITLETVETTLATVLVFAGALATCRFRPGKMHATLDSAMLATDVADELVRRGMAFRDAHRLVAKAVRHAENMKWKLHELPMDFWRSLSPLCDESIQQCFDFTVSVERRRVAGGTSRSSVLRQLRMARRWLQKHRGGGHAGKVRPKNDKSSGKRK